MNCIQMFSTSLFIIHETSAQNISESNDGIHWVANFVTHVGQEIALGLVCGFGVILGDLQFSLILFQHGDIVECHHHTSMLIVGAHQWSAVDSESLDRPIDGLQAQCRTFNRDLVLQRVFPRHGLGFTVG